MDVIGDVLNSTIEQFMNWTETAAPKLLAAAIILIVGWLLAKLVKVGLIKGLKLIKLDTAAEKVGIDTFLQRGSIKASAVEVMGILVYWMLLLITILMAVKAVGFTQADSLVGEVISIIPRVVIGLVVLILGLSFAGFVSDVVQTAAVNAQIRQARLLANLSRYAIVVFVVIIALNHLSIGTEIIEKAILTSFQAVGLALALAFGLGCRDLAGKIATDHWESEKAASKALADASAAAAAETSGEG